jgi:Ca-activated chloride channel homolog
MESNYFCRQTVYFSKSICAMRQLWILYGLLILTLFGSTHRLSSQTNDPTSPGISSYRLSVPVDEVSLTFHATDAHGLPINDLKLDELHLLDNGEPPRKILIYQPMQNFPIRAGILMDTSESMTPYLLRNQAISMEYAQRLLRQQTDQAFVMDFAYLSEIEQPWTNDINALTVGIRKFTTYGGVQLRGTALFRAVYQACLYQFGKVDNAASGNFILLFSDGEDNAGRTDLQDAVTACQHSNTAIYAFRVEPELGTSSGPKTLAELASQTGGRVFYNDGSDAEIYNDLRIIEADLRNQYRLIYKPAELKHDGLFHRIELQAPERVNSINIRSGYYAPTR